MYSLEIFFSMIARLQSTKLYLDALLQPVLHCLDDHDNRVRYYACESLYNIAKVLQNVLFGLEL